MDPFEASFATLLDYFGPASWLFYAFTASATVALRRKEPSRPRPFRMPLYPLPPLLVAAISACIIVASLAASPLFCSIALGFVACGVPVHTYCSRRQQQQQRQRKQEQRQQRGRQRRRRRRRRGQGREGSASGSGFVRSPFSSGAMSLPPSAGGHEPLAAEEE